MEYTQQPVPFFWLIPCLAAFFGIAIMLALFGIWLWALIDCANNEPSTGNEKVIWILLIIFLHVLGAILYLLVRRPKRIKEVGR